MPPAETSTPPGSMGSNALAADPREEEPPRPLLSEIGARLAQALRRLRRGSAFRESLEEVIEESARDVDELTSQERLMLGNLLKFGELRVEDVMVPRASIVAVEEKISLSDLLTVFRNAQHSRLPLYRDTLDDPLGMVHIKDVLAVIEPSGDDTLGWAHVPVIKLRRDVLFVPGAMPALDLLLQMQATRIHLALVIDEYGGTDGLVSIEDLVEEIVGDIDDEHDVDEEPEIVRRPEGGFDADARIGLDDFRERSGLDIASADEEEESDTLAGLVVALLGRVPVRGEIVRHPAGFEFEILEADPRRVKRLRVSHVTAPRAASK